MLLKERLAISEVHFHSGYTMHLVEVAKDLAGNVLPAGLLVVHNTGRGRQDDETERTGGKHARHPTLDLVQRHRVTGRDDTALVDAADELHNNLAITVVIDDLKVTDVA